MPRLWPGSTIVCVASGPSLVAEDVEFVRGRAKVIVVNTSYQMALWADVLYACDAVWWKWANTDKKTHPKFHEFNGMKYALTAMSGRWPGVQVLKNTGTDGLELQPHGLRTGSNGGYQAINLAVHLVGPSSKIVLLGYDMQRMHGREHWHRNHPQHTRSPYPNFLKRYPTLVKPLAALGIEIVNCTRETALTCFPCRPLREVLGSGARVVQFGSSERTFDSARTGDWPGSTAGAEA